MGLEQAFECPTTLAKLRSGPLGTLLDGFCEWLWEQGFPRGSLRKHLSTPTGATHGLGFAGALSTSWELPVKSVGLWVAPVTPVTRRVMGWNRGRFCTLVIEPVALTLFWNRVRPQEPARDVRPDV